jgi:PKD repeat protein
LAVGTGGFYAGGRHFDEVAGNFDQVTPNSAEVAANSVKVASNFDAGRHNFTKVTLNFVKVAHNFDRVAHNFDRVARNFDRVARNFDRVARNFDRVARNFELAAPKLEFFWRTLPPGDACWFEALMSALRRDVLAFDRNQSNQTAANTLALMNPIKNLSRTVWGKCLLRTLALGAITLLAAAPARAVTFTWTTNTYLSGTTNFMTLATGWAKLASFSIGGSQVTFGGETWSAGGGNNNMQASGPNGFGFNFSRPNNSWSSPYNGYDPVSTNVVNKQGGYCGAGTGPYGRLQINGFVIGQEYQVQFIVADSRAAEYGRTVTIQPVSLDGNTLLGGDAPAVQYAYNNNNNNGTFAVVTADFVADGTSYGFVPWCLSSSSSPTGPQINAIRITTPPAPPAITADTTASSSTNYVGSAVTFSAAVGGTPTPTLQWEVSPNGGAFVPITGATNTTLTLSNLQLTNSGAAYALYATNSAGATNSTPVTLTVLAAPTSIAFNVQFTGSAFGGGNSPTQTGAAVIGGDADVWNTVSNPNGTLSPAGLANGTNLPLLDVSSIGTALTMDYVGDYIYCSEQDANMNPFTAAGSPYGNLMHGYMGSINGDTNTITLHNLPPGIYDLYLYACAGSAGQEQARVNVYTANGQKNVGCGPNSGSSTLTAGVNYLHLTPTVTTNGLLNISYYGTADSAQGLLDGFQVSGPSTDYTIIQSADTTSDSPATDYAGRTVKFMAAFSGNPAPTLQWEVDKNDGNGYVNVPNATNSTLTLTNVQTTDSGSYSLYANNLAGSLNSTPLTLTVQALPSVLSVDVQFVGLSLGSGWAATQVGGAVIGNVGGSDFWNPVSNLYPRNGQDTNTAFGTVPGLLDVGDIGTSLSLAYTGNLILNSGINTPFYGTGGAENLMQACLGVRNTNTGTVTIQGLQAGTYDLYLYSSAGNALQTPVTRFAANGAYDTAGPNNSNSVLTVEGNYVHLTPIVSASGVLTVSLAGLGGTADASLNGLQLSGPGATVLPPVASFTATPTNAFATQAVAFTDTSSGNLTNWVWNFGDGRSVTNTSGSVSHAYAAAGTYNVSLTAKGPGGANTTNVVDAVTVYARPTLGSPVLSAGSLTFSGTGGIPNAQYRILTATNVALPLASWTPVATNTIAADGSYSYTQSSLTNAASFFRLVTP